ncbi:tail fiber assembly protein [Pseudomonas huaxiensis]|uniref:phage tail assembly chaperone n=1 Tax=Pseudomonas huaxiensis TaxID=2213017 RepID=UPI000DA65DE9|nr:phage tail assembly chaperone [Pseudomonas huaxiensis]
MTTFYSPGETGFFDTLVHASGQIPADAIKVSAARRVELLQGLSLGQVIRVGIGGDLELVDPPVDPKYAVLKERAWRDSAITQVSWLRERHRDEQDLGRPTTLTTEQFATLLAFLQLLRDWPESEHFPDIEQRPLQPPWLAELLG